MAWNLQAQFTETCSCNMFCPCWFAVPEYMVMDQGWCATTFLFQIESGESEGVDLSGQTVAVAAHFPGPTLFDGDGTARLYIDQGASSEQARELEAIFQGKKGPPMEIVNSLTSTWLPTEKTRIEVATENGTVKASVGDFGQIVSTALKDEEGNGFTIRGGGLIGGMGMQEAELAPGKGTSWSDSGLPLSFESNSGGRGTVTWSG